MKQAQRLIFSFTSLFLFFVFCSGGNEEDEKKSQLDGNENLCSPIMQATDTR